MCTLILLQHCMYIGFKCDLDEIPHCESSLGVPNPVVKLSSLDEDNLIDLEAQMRDLTYKIDLEFEKLFRAMYKSFKKSEEIDHNELVITLTKKERFFEPAELRQTKTVYDVLLMVKSNCSYFNYEVLQTLVKVHGSDQDKSHLEEYEKAFAEYCSVMPCAERVENTCKSNRTKLNFKLDFNMEQLKESDIKSIQSKIARHLRIRPSSLYLSSIENGCILLGFLVPNFIVDDIFLLSDAQILALYSEVKVLSIESATSKVVSMLCAKVL